MECSERDRLREFLSSALQELARFYEQQERDAATGGSITELSGDGVPLDVKQRQQEAASNYRHHVTEHACSDYIETGELLQEQLQLARVAHLAASARFDLLAKESPSGVPHPDGSLRIHKASSERSAALQRYMLALKQLTDHALSRRSGA
jgi:hypothetical protein